MPKTVRGILPNGAIVRVWVTNVTKIGRHTVGCAKQRNVPGRLMAVREQDDEGWVRWALMDDASFSRKMSDR